MVCPAVIVTLAGTVAAAVLVLAKATARSLVKAVGIPTVPVEAPAPAFSAAEVGFRVRVNGGAAASSNSST